MHGQILRSVASLVIIMSRPLGRRVVRPPPSWFTTFCPQPALHTGVRSRLLAALRTGGRTTAADTTFGRTTACGLPLYSGGLQAAAMGCTLRRYDVAYPLPDEQLCGGLFRGRVGGQGICSSTSCGGLHKL